MASQYVIVGLDTEANNHIATVLLGRKVSNRNPKRGYIKDGNVTILDNFEANLALLEDETKHVLLVVTRAKLREYVNIMTEFDDMQNKFKLVIFNGNEDIREQPEMKQIIDMCRPGYIEVEEMADFSATRNLIENAVSGRNIPTQRTLPQPRTMRKSSSTGKGLDVPVQVVIIGGPATGKSSLGNLILQEEAFESDMYVRKPVTEIKSKQKDKLTVHDVPSSEGKSKYTKVTKLLKGARMEQVVLIYTLRFGTRMTQEETTRMEILRKTFGDDFLSNHLCLAITFGDEFEVMRRQGKVKEFHSFMESSESFGPCSLLPLCQGRYCLVNNLTETDEAEEQYREKVIDVIKATIRA